MATEQNSNKIEALVREMVFGTDGVKEKQRQLREMAYAGGLFFASIQNLYDAIGRGKYKGFTVPAMNLRGMTYDVARAIFRAALKNKVGPFVFGIARSEMGYTRQPPSEFAAVSGAAACTRGTKAPFLPRLTNPSLAGKPTQPAPKKNTKPIKPGWPRRLN